MARTALLAGFLCAVTPAVAHAQLYAWQDGSGALILSKSPRDTAGKPYQAASQGTRVTAYRATTPTSPRAALYDDLIAEHAAQHSLSPDFVRAVIQAESAFNPWARSVKGAMGLMQLMPATAADYKVTNAYDPAQNIRAGVAYLKSLMTRYNNDVSLALAAYNAGPKAVEKYGNTVPPYRETRNYVARIKGRTDAARAVSSPNTIYKIVKVVDGREVVSYSQKPSPGAIAVR
jgi:soluble lytic murein transglycosylase-like protein